VVRCLLRVLTLSIVDNGIRSWDREIEYNLQMDQCHVATLLPRSYLVEALEEGFENGRPLLTTVSVSHERLPQDREHVLVHLTILRNSLQRLCVQHDGWWQEGRRQIASFLLSHSTPQSWLTETERNQRSIREASSRLSVQSEQK
jgi:hypothetical protein